MRPALRGVGGCTRTFEPLQTGIVTPVAIEKGLMTAAR